jgi:hypothetical protein
VIQNSEVKNVWNVNLIFIYCYIKLQILKTSLQVIIENMQYVCKKKRRENYSVMVNNCNTNGEKCNCSHGVSNLRLLYLPTDLAGHRVFLVDDCHITKIFTTLSQPFQTFLAILVVLISWGQFPTPHSPNMFLFHSHCFFWIILQKCVIG